MRHLVDGGGYVGHGEHEGPQPLGGEVLEVLQRAVGVLRVLAAAQPRVDHRVRALAVQLDLS